MVPKITEKKPAIEKNYSEDIKGLRRLAKDIKLYVETEYKKVLYDNIPFKKFCILANTKCSYVNISLDLVSSYYEKYPHFVSNIFSICNKIYEVASEIDGLIDRIPRVCEGIKFAEKDLANEKSADYCSYYYELAELLELLADKIES